MKEKQLIAAVLRGLPEKLHSQSMTFGSMSFNGTPDRYFDGQYRDLWVEFKQRTTMPRGGVVIGDFSELQLLWMSRRYANSKSSPNVVGMVGLPNKTVAVQTSPLEWREGTPVEQAVPIKEASAWIHAFCCKP